ncbi:glutathione S-transferase family protein [Marinobacterium sp. D7]|uniref:glutathione S-transferase family protein n=1 Tax=Marinobacterium ramblicola TaxID=2849041 RepID=UPI001C2DE723|nr:glutathione S-transferase family protein [Marinobacterium ramblicola]MBV1787995.1 glutathione S-transferase family protein [Marinobacterium ramblicola]
MATLHILGPTFSNFVRAVMLCCEEKGIDYTVGRELEGKSIGLKSEEHLKLHPHGKLPVLIHGDRVIFETAVICRYIDAAFEGPALQPDELWERTRVDQTAAEIALYIDQALVRKLLLEFAFPKGENGSVRMDAVEQAIPEARKALARVEALLGEREFIAADQYTLADALLTPMLDYISGLPIGPDLIPTGGALDQYLQRMRTRPSGIKVLKSRR